MCREENIFSRYAEEMNEHMQYLEEWLERNNEDLSENDQGLNLLFD